MSKKYTLSKKSADKHLLYQWAVQDPEQEVDLCLEQFKKRNRGAPKILREDFCGTANVATYWAASHPQRRAIGLDLDADTLEWGRTHNLATLGAASKRVDLRECDVRTVTKPLADIVVASNFSYFLIHTRTELLRYFEAVRQSLAARGLFILDCYGGWENQMEQKERRPVSTSAGTFGFVWEHESYDPITNRVRCHIHFDFKKRKRWKRAFSYDFRLYSIPEICETLQEAGFSDLEVLWDVSEDEDSSDFQPAKEAENAPGWIAYIVAQRPSQNGRASQRRARAKR